MNSAANETQHKCSCGRTFRHGISLKRHQKVSGCAPAEAAEVALPVVAALAAADESSTEKPAAPSIPAATPARGRSASGLAPISAPAPVAAAPDPFGDESGSVVVTAAQIARWQAEKNGCPSPLVEETAAAPALSIDWDGVKATCAEFVDFAGDQFCSMGRIAGWLVGVGARFTLFSSFVAVLGYVILFGISQDLSAAPVTSVDRSEAAEMAARSTVNSFLQTAQLDQFDRARGFLTSKTRETVSAGDLRSMFHSLPLNSTPVSVSSVLEQDGRVARVTLVRGGKAEVYTLVQEAQGWGLASVAVRRA